MALNPTNLSDDIIADTQIMGNIPDAALPQMNIFFQRLAVHFTNHIKRGSIEDVVTDPNTGLQLPPFPTIK